MFLDDVDVIARLFDFSQRFEVAEHRVLHVRIQHVFEKSREISQRERVARYGELELPVGLNTHFIHASYKLNEISGLRFADSVA